MKKLTFSLIVGLVSVLFVHTQLVYAYNFGDYRSETLVKKAWAALEQGDLEAVLAYTNKNMELYAEKAAEMQRGLDDYVAGENDAVFKKWALNDIATGLFIQGEAYRNANMLEEAKEAYTTIVNDYSYGQTWDPNGWFWKPAEASKEKLAMLASGKDMNYGDYSSSHLTSQAWKALGSNNEEDVFVYVEKVLELYQEQASDMQLSLDEYPWESKDKIFEYWALNDVGTALFIKGEILKKAGKTNEAANVYKELVDNYYFAQCWDPKGWFWKPAEAAQEALDELES